MGVFFQLFFNHTSHLEVTATFNNFGHVLSALLIVSSDADPSWAGFFGLD
jgi:hypothetical protein